MRKTLENIILRQLVRVTYRAGYIRGRLGARR